MPFIANCKLGEGYPVTTPTTSSCVLVSVDRTVKPFYPYTPMYTLHSLCKVVLASVAVTRLWQELSFYTNVYPF